MNRLYFQRFARNFVFEKEKLFLQFMLAVTFSIMTFLNTFFKFAMSWVKISTNFMFSLLFIVQRKVSTIWRLIQDKKTEKKILKK